MAEVVVDTNVLLVAEGKHPDVSEECVLSCIARLQQVMRAETVVLDDGYRLLSEYQNKLDPQRGKGVGVTFLKWLLQRQANSRYVTLVTINEHAADCYAEFPVPAVEPDFDPADRKFPAVSNAHPSKPPILQAADCKWLRWWTNLSAVGIPVQFLCPDDVCRFYQRKYPGEAVPPLP